MEEDLGAIVVAQPIGKIVAAVAAQLIVHRKISMITYPESPRGPIDKSTRVMEFGCSQVIRNGIFSPGARNQRGGSLTRSWLFIDGSVRPPGEQ